MLSYKWIITVEENNSENCHIVFFFFLLDLRFVEDFTYAFPKFTNIAPRMLLILKADLLCFFHFLQCVIKFLTT